MKRVLAFIVTGTVLLGAISFLFIEKNKKVDDLTKEVEVLNEQIREGQAKTDRLLGELDSLQRNIFDRDEKLERFRAEMIFLNRELDVALDSMSVLRRELESATGEKDKLSGELAGWIHKTERLQAEKERLNKELAIALRQLEGELEPLPPLDTSIQVVSPGYQAFPQPQPANIQDKTGREEEHGIIEDGIPDEVMLQSAATIRTLELKNRNGREIDKVRPHNWYSTDILLEIAHPDPRILNRLEGKYFGLEIFDEQQGKPLPLRESIPKYDNEDDSILRVKVIGSTIGGRLSNWQKKEGSHYRINVYYLPEGSTEGRKLRIPVINEKIITDNFIDKQFMLIF